MRWAADTVSWNDIPGVQIFGAILGIALVLYAIRRIFGKGK